MTTLLTVLLSTLIGAFVGKFLAMTTHFLPPILLEGCDKGREPADIIKWFFQKPFCWHCRQALTWKEYVPLVGFWLSKGKCPHCQEPLGLKIPILEWGVALLFGLSSFFVPLGPEIIFVWVASCFLICCFITDYEYQILPDQLTMSLVWVGLIGSLYPVFIGPQEAIMGAIIGYTIFWGFNYLYSRVRGFDGIYPGDFKLNAGIGACVGYKLLIPILIVSMASLLVITFLQTLYTQRRITADYFYKEIAYACFTSVVAAAALYLLLLGVIPRSVL